MKELNLLHIVLTYLVSINVVTFFMYGIDKWKAKKSRWRIREAKGKVLDVGAGSGCHSLVLQEKGIDVTAIDISPLSVETTKERGVKKVFDAI